MDDGIRKAIWGSMLTADMNARYWKSLVRRYVQRDKGLKISLALIVTSFEIRGTLSHDQAWVPDGAHGRS